MTSILQYQLPTLLFTTQGYLKVMANTGLTPTSFLQLSAYLSQHDLETNIKTANASHDLAAAAIEDSSAMKSIAILTMFFLLGIFYAALFAMPYLSSWDQPRHFVMYWVLTISTTIITFVILGCSDAASGGFRVGEDAAFVLARKLAFWRGKRGEDLEGGEESGKKMV